MCYSSSADLPPIQIFPELYGRNAKQFSMAVDGAVVALAHHLNPDIPYERRWSAGILPAYAVRMV